MSLPDVHGSRAVLIGVGAYKTLPELPAVAGNLNALETAFRSGKVWGLPADSCVVVSNPATNSELVSPIAQAADEATDTLFVYFAGHGMPHPRTGGLRLALPGAGVSEFYSAVSYDDIREVLLSSRAQRRIVVLDCCFSGRAAGMMADSTSIADYAGIEGTYILTSSAETEESLAPPGEAYTAFTGAFVDVLYNGIPRAPEFLNLEAIFRYLEKRLREEGKPIPQSRDRNDLGRLNFIRNQAFATGTIVPGYGEIEGVAVGATFSSRFDLHKSKVHRPLQSGICGRADRGGAESIVVSGGYPDDDDYGDVIIYTGHGGQDQNTGRQVADQDASSWGNRALFQSIVSELPVRVIRGAGGDQMHSPPSGFRYDGLYQVKDGWTTTGQAGFRILQFRLEALRNGPEARPDPGRWEFVSRGDYRSRAVAEQVKRAHRSECQICGETIETPSGMRYAEAVYIKDLATPHRGPDIPENCLCLCPNHAKRLQLGVITIDDDFQVIDEIEREPLADLHQTRGHRVALEYVQYHRRIHRLPRRTPGEPD
jgi:predicted restriction endonuclease